MKEQIRKRKLNDIPSFSDENSKNKETPEKLPRYSTPDKYQDYNISSKEKKILADWDDTEEKDIVYKKMVERKVRIMKKTMEQNPKVFNQKEILQSADTVYENMFASKRKKKKPKIDQENQNISGGINSRSVKDAARKSKDRYKGPRWIN